VVLAKLVKTRELADAAVKKAHEVLEKGRKTWEGAKAAVPVAEKVLKDAAAAIVKANADKKSALSAQDKVISNLQKEQKKAEDKQATRSQEETAA
jgi:PBP1b-binding outer membrane lipoprotein LpoB